MPDNGKNRDQHWLTNRGQINFNFEVVLHKSLLDYMNKEAQWAIESGTAQRSVVPNYRLMIRTEELRELKPDVVTIK